MRTFDFVQFYMHFLLVNSSNSSASNIVFRGSASPSPKYHAQNCKKKKDIKCIKILSSIEVMSKAFVCFCLPKKNTMQNIFFYKKVHTCLLHYTVLFFLPEVQR